MAKTARGPDNSARISVAGTIDATQWANVFHFQFTTSSAIVQTDFDAFVALVATNYKGNFAGGITPNVTFSVCKGTLFVPGNLVMASQSSMTGTGTQVGGPVNDNSCTKVVSWATNVYWRGGKPRTYFPGVAIPDTTGNVHLTSTAISNLQTAASSFLNGLNGHVQGTITGTTMGFVSFSSKGVALDPGVFHPILGAKVHPRLGSQRRRLGRWTP